MRFELFKTDVWFVCIILCEKQARACLQVLRGWEGRNQSEDLAVVLPTCGGCGKMSYYWHLVPDKNCNKHDISIAKGMAIEIGLCNSWFFGVAVQGCNLLSGAYVDTCSITHCGPYQVIRNCMRFNNQRIKKGELTCGKQPTILDQ
jgi:hypothetical protein